MIKILKLSVNDILFDSEAASDVISKACARKIPAKVAGICQVGDTVIISLEETTKKEGVTYVFAPLPAVNEEEVIGEISSRYYAGFSTKGVFNADEKRWALFAKEAPDNFTD